ncbi:MAG TPA: hypothetical protein VGF79_04930 [Bacteroidia bacterium]
MNKKINLSGNPFLAFSKWNKHDLKAAIYRIILPKTALAFNQLENGTSFKLNLPGRKTDITTK